MGGLQGGCQLCTAGGMHGSLAGGGLGTRILGSHSCVGASYCCLLSCGGLVHTQVILHPFCMAWHA